MLRVLFLNENSSYRFDNRARREMCTLRDAGAEVSVICPAYTDEPLYEVMDDGVECFRFRSMAGEFWEGKDLGLGFVSHLGEYATTIPLMAAVTAKVHMTKGFDVIHAVNPPDLLWTVAAPYKLLGKKFVFDHYDLNPELFEDRFGGSSGMKLLPLVRAAEKMSIRLADHVISTNESYRQIAIQRCGKSPEKVTVVRNGPDQRRFRQVEPHSGARALGDTVIGYLGNMNPQDGLDHFMEMARILRHEKGRDDVGYVLVGSGDAFPDLLAMQKEYGLEECMVFTGRLPAEDMMKYLSAADICVQPDPLNRLNNVSTMNKPMEYMALGKAVVAYDLVETRVTGGDVCQYVEGGAAADLAETVLELVNDPKKVKRLGKAGQKRVKDVLSWPHQVASLISVYEDVCPGKLDLKAAEAACALA